MVRVPESNVNALYVEFLRGALATRQSDEVVARPHRGRGEHTCLSDRHVASRHATLAASAPRDDSYFILVM